MPIQITKRKSNPLDVTTETSNSNFKRISVAVAIHIKIEMFSSMENPNHLVDFHSKLVKYFAKKNNLVLISKDGQQFEVSKEIIFVFSAKIEKECTESSECKKNYKMPSILLIRIIYF